ncbi:MAG: DUF3662 domain-containing protein [Proteobacteria bacterium]|nr:DUF3662 domain-containing protein [Pseudomonadota bacterium]
MGVNIARGLERRLERLFEGSAKRVFSGQVHPSELAERIAREADLARYEHLSGPATANQYLVTLNPRDVERDTESLIHDLERELSEHAAEAGREFDAGHYGVQIGTYVVERGRVPDEVTERYLTSRRSDVPAEAINLLGTPEAVTAQVEIPASAGTIAPLAAPAESLVASEMDAHATRCDV